MKYEFPKGFLWGASTSAHQVEGNNHNDWTEWEKENAERLAKEADKRWQPWQQERFPEMSDPQNYISGRACDHYNRYEEDFDIAKSLEQNAHRFSIEWSRIEPEEGKFDEKEIEHYQEVVRALRERKVEPFVTLWHWPFPIWLAGKGGFENKKIIEHFTRYAGFMAEKLPEVRFWITLNEPEIYASHSYLKGVWPPQKKSPVVFLRVMDKLTKSHISAYSVIKKINPNAQVGIAKNNIWFEATGPFSKLLKILADWFWNNLFLNKISGHQDFIGLNHYFHNRIKNGFSRNDNKTVSDMGWEILPESLYHCIVDLKKYNKPIYVTENGLADSKDEKREWFIKESLKNIHHAIKDGASVKGYLYWSLLDNFEWDKGFWPRFGLVEIDYKTLERKIRPSAYEYKKIIDENGFSD